MAYASNRADAIYTAGPEVITAHARRIVAGQVSGYTKEVLSASEPPGPDAIPLRWMVSGRVENPAPLKGPAMGSVNFTRSEGSVLIADTLDVPSWEQEYGDVREAGNVVLFFAGDAANAVTAIPSGNGELDLISLVRDLVAIQARPAEAQLDVWLAYLGHSRTAPGQQAALRSLVHMNADWKRMRPVLEGWLATPSINDQMRAFTFGIVVFGLTQNKWARDQASVTEFLGGQLATARTPGLALQYVLSMKLALGYVSAGTAPETRAAARTRVVAALLRNEAYLSRSPEVAEQYRQMRAAYPGLF